MLRQTPKHLYCIHRGFSTVSKVQVESPYSGTVVYEGSNLSLSQASAKIDANAKIQRIWSTVSLEERKTLCKGFIESFLKTRDESARQISLAMGKPLSQSQAEIDTMVHRAQTMINLSDSALAEVLFEDSPIDSKTILKRKITREPIGPVLILSPWNYPLLCTINVLIPSILSGNSVLIKHADRTAFCADILADAFKDSGAPADLVTALMMDHPTTQKVLHHPDLSHISFTGSVAGGVAVNQTISQRMHSFPSCSLELGGKDAAYVTETADVQLAAESIVDGALYNAGQSCCAVERVYVHESLYEEFLHHAYQSMSTYVLGDPLSETTTLGPMAQQRAIEVLEGHVDQARVSGAQIMLGGSFAQDIEGMGRFFQPTLLASCSHDMAVMKEESFGPLLPVMKVKSDEEAVRLINDSAYGLTASIWSRDEKQSYRLARGLAVGTVFMNRSDYVDPFLAWSGRKDSGRGVSLSKLGFDSVTVSKSYNFKVPLE